MRLARVAGLARQGQARLWERLEAPLQQSSRPPRPALPQLVDFPIRVSDIVRFADLDRQGHVNNAVFATFLETGRVGTIYDPENGFQVPGATSVLARVEIDFLQELRWPGAVEIGSAIATIGRSSYTFTQGIFHNGICAATGRSTLVLIDAATRRSRPLPPEIIKRLERFKLRAG
jgi:acyl-CoA thioester hydrolase